MKKLISVLLAAAMALTVSAQTLYKNVQKGTDGNNRLVESLAVPTGKTLTAEAGSTLTLSGSVGGTPTGGTLNFSNLTFTLPATVSGGTSSFQPLDAALTALAGGSDFVQFTGPLTTTKIYTLPDLSATLLYAGGALGTPSSGTATNLTGLPTTGLVDDAVTFAKMQNIATDRLIGRDTALTGDPEEISLGASLEFGGAGTIQRAALTGDVTAAANSNATTLATVNANVGSFGSATAAPTFTVNGKGLITAAGSATVTPAVGSITGLGTGVATALAANANAAGGVVTTDGTATLTNKTLTTPDINAGTVDSLTSLSIRSTGAAFDLFLTTPSVFTLNRTLTITPGDASRTITLTGNPTLADWFDQSVKSGASPTFVATNFSGSSGITGTGVLASGSINWTGAITTTAAISGGAISGTTGAFSGLLSLTASAASTADNAVGTYSRWRYNGLNRLILGTANQLIGAGSTDNAAIGNENGTGALQIVIGTTGISSFSSGGLAVTGTVDNTYSGAGPGRAITNSSDTSGTNFLDFKKAVGTTIGSVKRVTTTDSVSYETTSDENFKIDIRPVDEAEIAAAVEAAQVVLFKWKSDLTQDLGVIAQGLAASHPLWLRIHAVTPGSVSPGYDYAADQARLNRKLARRVAYEAANRAHAAEVKRLTDEHAAGESARKQRLGRAKWNLLQEQAALLAPAPQPTPDEFGDLPPAKSFEQGVAEAKRIAHLQVEIAKIPAGDRTPAPLVLPPVPELEIAAEDALPEYRPWMVNADKVTWVLLAYAQIQSRRLTTLAARVAALEARP